MHSWGENGDFVTSRTLRKGRCLAASRWLCTSRCWEPHQVLSTWKSQARAAAVSDATGTTWPHPCSVPRLLSARGRVQLTPCFLRCASIFRQGCCAARLPARAPDPGESLGTAPITLLPAITLIEDFFFLSCGKTRIVFNPSLGDLLLTSDVTGALLSAAGRVWKCLLM